MGHGLKKPGILRAGFYYQDLIGIEILIGYYRDASLYQWVCLEGGDEFAAIDDVVACRPDGRFDLIQVKFTPDPAAPSTPLDWSWLLETTGGKRARSLLQKWAKTTLAHSAAGTLHTAAVRTDRRPDQTFTACLNGETVDFDKIPAAIQVRILAQLGDEAAARSFFANFAFRHSEPLLEDLEYQLKARLVPSDTNDAGWQSLTTAAWIWATHKHRPSPDGQVRHRDLVQIISRKPAPIPQDFQVPAGYAPPDSKFHQAFVQKVTQQDGTVVLWGPPGRGKSTYLSHLIDRKHSPDEVWVRHHYFLSLTDRTTARFYYAEIARSLIDQIEGALPDLSGGLSLSETVKAAAANLQGRNGRLIIVVDGLDHVWREGRSVEQMAQLFNELLPLPTNVTLLVGTQKVPDDQLPARLLQRAPKAGWTELPLMSPRAVEVWLKGQHASGRLQVAPVRDLSPALALARLARAFYDTSLGLPLHLIYAFEALVRKGGAISTEDVSALPSCPDGDIRTYYEGLWTRIEPRAREVLHILAGLEFGLPPVGLLECFGRDTAAALAVDQIDHLLDRREIGVLPFHGSIFAFVRDRAEHKAVFSAHAPSVVAWLETVAPTYWRWAWLWITKAQLGDDDDLFSGPDRDWVVSAMANGYPLSQIATVLEHAQAAAFSRFDLPKAYLYLHLHIRIENAPEFQLHDFALFFEASTVLSNDSFPRLAARDDITRLSPTLMAPALRTLSDADPSEAAGKVFDDLNRRMRHRMSHRAYSSQPDDWRRDLVSAAAWLNNVNVGRLATYVRRFTDADGLLCAFARESLLAGRAAQVIALAKRCTGRSFTREVVVALCLEGLAPSAIDQLKGVRGVPLGLAFAALHGQHPKNARRNLDVTKFLGPAQPYERVHPGIRSAIHGIFFAVFAAALRPNTEPLHLTVPANLEDTWLGEVFEEVAVAAQAIAEAWADDQETPSIAALYAALDIEEPHGQGFDVRSEFIAVRLSVMDIAIDLQTLCISLAAGNLITSDDLASAQTSPLWLDELWLDAFTERRLPLHHAQAVELLIETIERQQTARVTQFDERARIGAQLALLARDHELVDLGRHALHRAADCAIGYIWRKDPFAFEVLGAIENLASSRPNLALEMLLSLAPIYDAITEFTDSDGTRHARGEYYELVAQLDPGRGAHLYEALLGQEAWHYADELLRATAKALAPTPARAALLRTFIQPAEWDQAQAMAAENLVDDAVMSALRLAIGPGRLAAKPSAKPTKEKKPRYARAPAVGTFGPDQLNLLLGRKRSGRLDYDVERGLVGAWLLHWEGEGRGKEALNALRAAVDADPQATTMFDTAYDVAFQVARRISGRTEAFPWLVLAHRHRYGWHRFMTDKAEGHERLDRAASDYPTRWKDFIRETAAGVRYSSSDRQSWVMGTNRLVYFLLKCGQDDEAIRYTQGLVDILKAELSDQPLPASTWAA